MKASEYLLLDGERRRKAEAQRQAQLRAEIEAVRFAAEQEKKAELEARAYRIQQLCSKPAFDIEQTC